MRPVFLLVVGACIAGCSGSDQPATPDGSIGEDSGPIVDGPQPGAARLIVAWATGPAVPGDTTGGHHYDDVKFRMENFKATVDIDPTDPNTTQPEYKLHWDDNDTPTSITFDNAPPGRVTSIVLQLDEGDGEEAFELKGTTSDDDSFLIEDNSSLSISMTCNVMLEANATKTVTIDIDLATAIDAVDFDGLDSGGGADKHLDGDEAAMATFRTALQSAFTVRAQ